MDSQNQNWGGGGGPQTHVDGRAYGAWCAFGTIKPRYKSLDPPLLDITKDSTALTQVSLSRKRLMLLTVCR